MADGVDGDDASLLNALPAGVAVFASDGTLLHANPAFAQATGAGAKLSSFDTIFGDSLTDGDIGRQLITTIGERSFAIDVATFAGDRVVCTLHDVSELVASRAAALAQSGSDPLTGLANRSGLVPELERVIAARSGVAALLMIDLDHFKKVNDTLGHPVGDSLLCKVAERLQSSLRPTDRLVRLGGDEFAVLQTAAAQPLGAEMLAKRLVELIGRPYIIDGHMIDIGVSIGVALAGSVEDAAELMKQADIAMYRAKAGGRGQYAFFEQSMDADMQARRAMEIDLRSALAFRQFELYYQPQIDLATRTLSGMEALIRWRHPVHGLVSPGDFIPLAEETGLIIPIGEWVIRKACDDAASWPLPVPVAVNVSAKQLANGKLVNTVTSALANSGVDPARFDVEITESVLMSDVDGCIATLHALKALGVRVSMDDFGTGYSSLSYLQSFPFHTIKIDQSFIRSSETGKSDAIIRAIAAIGQHLEMRTTAEGVETAEQLANVTSSGCGSAQGFLISHPVPAEEISALMNRLTTGDLSDFTSPPSIVAIVEPPEPDLYRAVYYSLNAIIGLDEEVRATVDDILATSQRNNARDGLTGALMFTEGYFAQVLEGSREAIERVFERIQRDERHCDVQLLSFDRASHRLFGNWAMAFVGNSAEAAARFGHYGSKSGFDFAAADGDDMTRHLRALLVDEERLQMKAA